MGEGRFFATLPQHSLELPIIYSALCTPLYHTNQDWDMSCKGRAHESLRGEGKMRSRLFRAYAESLESHEPIVDSSSDVNSIALNIMTEQTRQPPGF